MQLGIIFYECMPLAVLRALGLFMSSKPRCLQLQQAEHGLTDSETETYGMCTLQI